MSKQEPIRLSPEAARVHEQLSYWYAKNEMFWGRHQATPVVLDELEAAGLIELLDADKLRYRLLKRVRTGRQSLDTGGGDGVRE